MEIIIRCKCGNPFAFDEEPASGRMPAPVKCPLCGQDCTDKANDFIFKVLQGKDPLKGASSLWARLTGANKNLEDLAALRRPTKPREKTPLDAVAEQRAVRVRLLIGSAGAVAAGLLCAYGWYWLAMATGFYFGFVAWIIGGIVGGISRLAAPGGGIGLAGIAGLSAGVAILIGHVAVFRVEFNDVLGKAVQKACKATTEYAEKATTLKTDEEIREFLAINSSLPELQKTNLNETDSLSRLAPTHPENLASIKDSLMILMTLSDFPGFTFGTQQRHRPAASITGAQIQSFRATELPECQKFASSKAGQTEWQVTLRDHVKNRISFSQFIGESLGPYSFFWMFLGLGTAAKLAYNKSETEDV